MPVSMPSAKAGVLGMPIEHSRSPLLHSTAYALLGEEIEYRPYAIREDHAGRAASVLRHEPGWRGVSVTMPLKQAMVAHVEEVSRRVQLLGALNTVTVRPGLEEGEVPTLYGENTDVDGVIGALSAAGVEIIPGFQPPLVLGAGGTAVAVLAALKEMGADAVRVAVRNPAKATEVRRVAEALHLRLSVIPLTSVKELAGVAVVVSTLPPRAADAWARDVASLAVRGDVLLDVAYDPWPSALAREWEAVGGVAVHGLAMLVYQAVEQISAFTGRDVSEDPRIVPALCDAVGITPQGQVL